MIVAYRFYFIFVFPDVGLRALYILISEGLSDLEYLQVNYILNFLPLNLITSRTLYAYIANIAFC
jgi:hypothetical protein